MASVNLTWTASNPAPVNGYRVKYWPTSSPTSITTLVPNATGTSCTIPGLTADTSYSGTIEATCVGGTHSAPVNWNALSSAQPPASINLAQIAFRATNDGCPTSFVLRIYLDAADFAVFLANSNAFAGAGGGTSTTCTLIARNSSGNPITSLLYDSDGICWELNAGVFTYNQDQC